MFSPLIFLPLILFTPARASSTPDPLSSSSWPTPEKVTGNPSGWGTLHVHDPSIVYNDGWFYSFTTHDLVAIGKSRTLSGYWQHAGSVLHGESVIDL